MNLSPYFRLAAAITRAHAAEARADIATEKAEHAQRELREAFKGFVNEEGAALLDQPAPVAHREETR